MGFVSIIAQVESILNTVTDVSEVHDFDKGTFNGYPAVVIYPTENTSEFSTTTENRREYVFTIRIHYPMQEAGGDSHQRADRILREVVDQVIAEFDKRTNASLGGTVCFTQAVPSTWGYQTRESGVLRVAEVTLRAVEIVSVV